MRIVLDIETEPFGDEFRKASGQRERVTFAPRPLIACVYLESTRGYRFFTPDRFDKLLVLLREAHEIVTFNGESFDFPVLQKYFGITRRKLTSAESLDLFPIVSQQAGFKVSLDALARLNLGEKKKVKGKELLSSSLKELKEGCKSDVRQTYRLWKLHCGSKLQIPLRSERRYHDTLDSDFPLFDQNMPYTCPECKQEGSLIPLEANETDMTEGQMADYSAGNWGYAYCPLCRSVVFWEA